MNFQDAQNYLNAFVNYEKTGCSTGKTAFKLGRIKSFLRILGDPQDDLKVLHIAGSKGKGATCAFLAHILSQAGFKTGLYTSPHLISFRERIRILKRDSEGDFSGMISVKDLTKYAARLKPAVEKFRKSSRYGDLTFFEVYTALAFLYFKEKKVDFAVMETGLGGRLDATNVADSWVAGITPISYEHTQILGKTLAKIAAEKSGIIKNKRQVVICAPQSPEAKKVIEARCLKVKARLFSLGKEIKYTEIKTDVSSQTFRVKSFYREYPILKSRLLGRHQMVNAAMAIAMAEALRFYNIFILPDAVRDGISAARWPGRFEVVCKHPMVVIDGAQNVASCRALKDTLKGFFSNKKVILILGVSQDKDLRGICKELEPVAQEVILTQSNNPRAALPAALKTFFSHKAIISSTFNIQQALSLALKKAKENDLILATGSLFVVGEARKICLS